MPRKRAASSRRNCGVIGNPFRAGESPDGSHGGFVRAGDDSGGAGEYVHAGRRAQDDVQFRLSYAIMSVMTSPRFQIVQQRDHTFNVNLTKEDGRLKTIAGFGSEHEAAAWVVQTERMLQQTDPRFRVPSREKSHPLTAAKTSPVPA
jgi:hypothetical protein